MEKIKLSTFAKKAGKFNEENSNQHSVIEEMPTTQGKFVKYFCFYSDKLKKAQNKWKRFKNTDKILPKLRLPLRLITLMNCFEFLVEMKRKISKCSNL